MSYSTYRATDEVMDGVTRTGGATVSLAGDLIPVKGFMVGGVVAEMVIPRVLFSRISIHNFILEHYELLTHDGYYVGAWLNTETGNVHLDVSQHYESGIEAVRVAKERNELSIWNLTFKQEVWV